MKRAAEPIQWRRALFAKEMPSSPAFRWLTAPTSSALVSHAVRCSNPSTFKPVIAAVTGCLPRNITPPVQIAGRRSCSRVRRSRRFVEDRLTSRDIKDAPLGDFINRLDFTITLRVLADRVDSRPLPLWWNHHDLAESGWAAIDDLTDVDRPTSFMNHTVL